MEFLWKHFLKLKIFYQKEFNNKSITTKNFKLHAFEEKLTKSDYWADDKGSILSLMKQNTSSKSSESCYIDTYDFETEVPASDF